ncbi:MAG: type I-A CRISPR-associated protein Cas4/Csa1 [Candidatus Hadarchaeales archaeon]
MVFFLSAQEHKLLLNRVLPLAREVGVTQELRGWNWWREPLKPYYPERISMFSVCGKFCPTGRDVYLMYVEKKQGKPTQEILLGAMAHNLLEHLFGSCRQGRFDLGFEEWWKGELGRRGEVENAGALRSCLEPLWELVLSQARAAYLETRAAHPYADEPHVLAVALPFLVEHKLDGRLLGLSGTLSVDCYDYLRHLIFDVKVGGPPRDFYRLYPTGYALVFESLYEVPVDVGCSVHVGFRNGRVVVNRDLFFINDDLRNWWLEERDRKLELVAQRRDPGRPAECRQSCLFSEVCA